MDLPEKETPKIGIFSFFTGAGFLDLGFEMTPGFKVLLVNEHHGPFMDVYKSLRTNLKTPEPYFGHNTKSIATFLDTRGSRFLGQSIEEAKANHDLIGFIGGPPCPDFSVGGKNKGIKGENGKLSGTYIELIVRNNPDFFLFENVKGLYRTKKHKKFFDSIKNKLIANGYYITEKLINAIEYGAPQDRERIILIGFKRNVLTDLGLELNGNPVLNAFPWNSGISHFAKDVLSLEWPGQEAFAENSVKKCPVGILKELTVEHWFRKNDVNNHPNSNHCFKPRAGLAKFLTIDEGDDLKKSYKRLHRWRYSPTAAYGNNEVHLHPYKARRISVADALAVQSLPKEAFLPSHVSLTDMFKTIGNGVPFLASKGLAETILDYVKNLKIKNPEYAEVIG